jgi:toxin ParE1/3/4
MARPYLTDQAERDLQQIWDIVAERSLLYADRLIAQFASKAQMLADMPGIGRRREDLLPFLRSYPHGRYVIFYRLVDDGIEIIRVLHGARNIDRFFGKPSRPSDD